MTGTLASEQRAADIVVHYVPHAGGVQFGGYALCGDHGCPNILVRSDLTKSERRRRLHARVPRLGDATTSSATRSDSVTPRTSKRAPDLMGYGWPDLGDPVLSQCDIDGIAFVFAWAIEGSTPHRPADGPFVVALADSSGLKRTNDGPHGH